MCGATFGRVLAALITCSLMGLAGCADDDPVASAPSASPSVQQPTPSASPSEPETSRPETAREFIRRWPVVETKMINTGETAKYRAIYDTRCRACERLARRVQEIYANGGYARTAGWEIDSIRHVKVTGATGRLYVVRTTASPTELRSSADGSVTNLPGGKITHQVTLRKLAGDWRIVEVVELGTPA
jgi:hypothetical protein